MTRTVLILFAALAFSALSEGRSLAGGANTTVRENADGSYCIAGSFDVQAPQGVAWGVLKDYDHLRSFVTSMRRSSITARHPDHLVVEQEGSGKVLLMSKRIYVRLEVREQPEHHIAFRDVSGRSFHEYAGSWRVSAAGGRVEVFYELHARPA